MRLEASVRCSSVDKAELIARPLEASIVQVGMKVATKNHHTK